VSESETCANCGLNPKDPKHAGRQLYVCDLCGAAPLCSDCTENARQSRVFCLRCAEENPEEVVVV
jgi:hypothetical protein